MHKRNSLNSLSLEEFLEYKTLYYDKIDFSVVKNAWEILSTHIQLPYVIHIVGTNGKGTTGRFLAHYLNSINKDVLHYTSPHITKFNERIWINGTDVADNKLEEAHQSLVAILPDESLHKLTYFEYTTLLALFLSSNRDYIVLEAGLGGEFDATNVVKNDLSLITTIGLDHMNFLGDTIEAIAKTKMRACDNTMIIGYQQEPEKIMEYAQEVSCDKGISLSLIQADMKYDLTTLPLTLPTYLEKNLCLTIEALRYLGLEINLDYFKGVVFQGRCQRINENITIDVGHNPLAAQAIFEEFAKINKKIILVYNSFEDKDYEAVLSILKPIIHSVEIIEVNDKRVVNRDTLTKVCDNLNIMSSQFTQIEPHKNYLVFGSFLVVEAFLKFLDCKELNEK